MWQGGVVVWRGVARRAVCVDCLAWHIWLQFFICHKRDYENVCLFLGRAGVNILQKCLAMCVYVHICVCMCCVCVSCVCVQHAAATIIAAIVALQMTTKCKEI